jgi:prepilin-type N-terminal cleavage/methylation domain-containing protein
MRGVVRTSAEGYSHGAGATASRGLTILELLIAIVIFAVAMLALAATLLSDFSGIRREGQITVANQVAVTGLERLRGEIGEDSGSAICENSGLRCRRFDLGETGTLSVVVGGATYTGTYTGTPRRSDGLAPSALLLPHLFEVTFTIDTDGTPRPYSTLVVRRQ